MKKFPTEIHVVAAALTIADGRFLLQRRGPGGRHGGLWEFPGGKVESGEDPEFALIREIEEELGMTIVPGSLMIAGAAREPATPEFPAIVMNLYITRTWRGEPAARQGQEWGWFDPVDAARLAMPAMDAELLAALDRWAS